MQNDYAQQYGDLQQWHWWFRGRRSVIQSILRDELRANTARNIVSAGCGPAQDLSWLLEFAGANGKVVGLDIDPIHASGRPKGIDFVAGPLEDVPFGDQAFDVVLALDVLEHLDNDLAGLREALRILKLGGLLLITVPALPSLWGAQDIVSRHRRRYTKRSLKRLLKETVSGDCQVRYFNTILFPAIAMIRWSRRALGLSNYSRSDFESNRPGVINDMLAWTFGLERYLISRVPMPLGASLLVKYAPPPIDSGTASDRH